MIMPLYCGVIGCARRGERDAGSFFRIPAKRNFVKNIPLSKLSESRRAEWIRRLNRKDLSLNVSKLKHLRICEEHFVSGKPASLDDEANIDWAPSLKLGYEKKQNDLLKQKRSERYRRRSENKERLQVEMRRKELDVESKRNGPDIENKKKEVEIDVKRKEAEIESTRDETEVGINISNYEVILGQNSKEISEPIICCSTSTQTDTADFNKSVQTDLTLEDISNLIIKLSNWQIGTYLPQGNFSYQTFINDDKITKYYTGLDSFFKLNVIIDEIKTLVKNHPNCVLSPEDQIILCLMKLRLNLDFIDLGYRFHVSRQSAANYFYDILEHLFTLLKQMIIWPDRQILRRNLPHCFQENFKKTTIIIDCFEIFIQTPSNFLSKAQCYSNYKHHETIKYLIGISPQGFIMYISEAWGGRTSDKYLTENSNLFSKICPGDVILADRGFLIKDFVNLYRAELNLPAFTKGQNQLKPIEIEKTRSIANVRIHVERIIGSIRQKYKITSGILPISTVSKTVNGSPAIDKIVIVCCALINLCPGIIKD